MRRYPQSPEQPRDDYDPLNPQSAFYQNGPPAGPDRDGIPDFIPAPPPRPNRNRPPSRQGASRRPRRRKGRPLRMIIWTLVSLAAVAFVLNQFVFQVRRVSVDGRSRRSADEIVRMAGLSDGGSIFRVSREDVETALSQDRYLKLTGFEKVLPSTLKLTVRDRGLCANIQFNSIWHMIDEEGFVLEKLTKSDPRNNLLTVGGIQVRDARVGRQLIPAREDQLNSYTLVMQELLSQGYATDILDLYVGDAKNITLRTRTGYTVSLGSAGEYLMAKIAILRGIVPQLVALGKESGTIDLADVRRIIYSP